MRTQSFGLGAALAATLLAMSSCGSTKAPGFDQGGSGSSGSGGPGFGDDGGDECVAMGLPHTTVSGTVYDPAGKNPLYDVVVFVPASPVQPFPSGVTCDRCGVLLSGSPIVSTLTDPDGHFSLQDVPSGDDVPLVMQIGKWRRQITVSHVDKCTDNPIADPSLTRLPRDKTEGDIPQMALTTGLCDPFECLLRKIGIADSEFTDPSGDGRVHLVQGSGTGGSMGARLGSSPSARSFWSDASMLNQYDVIINACECNEHPEEKPQSAVDALVSYANAGGRLFNTHFHYFWLDPQIKAPGETSPWSSTAHFIPEPYEDNSTERETIDTSFPKGQAFAQWLANVGATQTTGQLPIVQTRYNATAVNPPSLRWIYGTDPATQQSAIMHYTFNTPVDASDDQQCGKVLFSDFHVVPTFDTNAAVPPPTSTFPQECNQNAMTPQEKALEFMLFDLTACIQKDTRPPQPPPQ